MDIQDIARNTFTVSALLLTATLVLLNYSWKRLKTLIKTMPSGKQRVTFNFRSISDPIESDKYVYISIQFISCILLILSLAGALIAVFIMSGVMVGDIEGIYVADNFEFAVVAMRVSVFCLFMGIFALALVYLEDLIAIYVGGLSIITTKLEDLPPKPVRDRTWSHIAAGLMFGFLIILFVIDVFTPFNQWAKMAIALAVGITLIIIARVSYRCYARKRSKQVSTTSRPYDSKTD